MNKPTKVVLSIAIIASLSMNYILINRINSIQNNVNIISNQVHSLSSQLSNVRSDLNTLNEGEKLIIKYNYDIEENSDFKKARVKINVALNRLENNSKVFFMYRNYESESKDWKIKEVQNQAGLNFTTEVDLSYDGNYEAQLMMDTGSHQVSEAMGQINLKNELNNRLHMKISPRSADTRGNFTFETNIRNNYYNGEALKLKSINAYIYFDNKLVHKVDIMDKGKKRELEYEPIEEWNYNESIVIEELKRSVEKDFMKLFALKLVVVDQLGKKYEYVSDKS